MKKILFLLTVLFAFAGFHAAADEVFESELHSFRLTELVSGLDKPWGVAVLGDDTFLISLKSGAFLYIHPDGKQTLSPAREVVETGQGGLLDLVPAPDYRESGRIFFTFATGSRGKAGTALGTARVDNNGRVSGMRTLWEMDDKWKTGTGHHFGSRLVFDNEGFLYMTIGDRGRGERAQDKEDPAGSVLRFDPSESGNLQPQVYTYGHRNSQGIALHPDTGKVWLHEHGPKGGDEINILREGGNYGWPVLTYGLNYNGTVIAERATAPGYEDPLLHWTPSIAPSGMAFYRGDAFPDWNNSLFSGALAGRQLRRVELRGERFVDQEILLKDSIGRIRDVRHGPDGLIYLLQDGNGASLFRLEPVS